MESYSNIKLPDNLDEMTLEAIKKAEIYKRKSKFTKRNISIAATIAIALVVGIGTTFPVIAQQAPIISKIIATLTSSNTNPKIKVYNQKSTDVTNIHIEETYDKDIINNSVPFEINEAKVEIPGLVEDYTKLITRTITTADQNPIVIATFHSVETYFKDKDNPQKFVLVSQTEDTGKPYSVENPSSSYKKINIGGTDVFISPTDNYNTPVQILFWINRKYYNVTGCNIDKDQLLKVVESLF